MDATFEAEWLLRFPDTPPLGHRLRERHPDRWLRVHSLPEGKRYADADAEVAEVLKRANRAATAVLGDGASCWLVVPEYELNKKRRVPELPGVALARALTVDDPARDEPLTFWAARTTWRPGGFDAVHRAAAGAVFAPYDGGVDLVLASAARRDALREELRAWLSDRPDGL